MLIGPYERLNDLFPLYVLQFDKQGAAKSPKTTKQILSEIAGGTYTDVYVFSHGWNNDFGDAIKRYRGFFLLYLQLRAKYRPREGEYRPLFIGLHWPSIILTLRWESGPRIAAATGNDAAEDSVALARGAIAEMLDLEQRARFYELTEGALLSEMEAKELARILLPLYRRNALDADTEAEANIAEDGLVGAWMSLPGETKTAAPDYSKRGFTREEIPQTAARAAPWTDFIDPRNPLRLTTVLMMKDRAGLIGRNGLASLLVRLAGAKTPLRLIGHSYGGRVCLTALTSPALEGYKATSLLLLQPAVNQYCFAPSVPGLGIGVPGGFVRALDHLSQPVYTTFSHKDKPLHAMFHLAAQRVEDRGEIRYAAEGDSEFSALGGYGPAGLPESDLKEETIHGAGQPYEVPPGVRVLALDGSAGQIGSHGDVVSEYTCWALLDQEMH